MDIIGILRLTGGILLALLPFAVVFWLLCKVKRNTGSKHGGGIEGYRRIRRGP